MSGILANQFLNSLAEAAKRMTAAKFGQAVGP
jgi:hypothetical protein